MTVDHTRCCNFYSKKNGSPIPTPDWRMFDQAPEQCTCGKYGKKRDCLGYTPLHERKDSLADPVAIAYNKGKQDWSDRLHMSPKGDYVAAYFRGYLEAALNTIEANAETVKAQQWKHCNFSIQDHCRETIDNITAAGSRRDAIFVMAHVLDLIGVELGEHEHLYNTGFFNSGDIRRRDLSISTDGILEL